MIVVEGYFCRYGCVLSSFVLIWHHLDNSIQNVVGRVTLHQPARRKDPPKNTQQDPKPNYNKRAHINGTKHIPWASSSGNQWYCTTECHRSPTIDIHTMKTGSNKSNMQKQEESTKLVRQRKNIQSKGKEESPERVLNEIEESKLSNIKFKIMVIRSSLRTTNNLREDTRTDCKLHLCKRT